MSTPIPIFDPEDPKLTAYALGELTDPAARAEVERLLQHSPAAQLAMKDIQELTKSLSEEYDQERRSAVVEQPDVPVPSNVISLPERHGSRRNLWLTAAALLLIGAVVTALLPVVNRAQVPGGQSHHYAQSGARQESRTPQRDVPSAGPVTEVLITQFEAGKLGKSAQAEPKPEAAAAGSGIGLQPATPGLALNQPAKGEFQKYPGRPQTTSLDEVFGMKRGDLAQTESLPQSAPFTGNLQGLPTVTSAADAAKSGNYYASRGLASERDSDALALADGEEQNSLRAKAEPVLPPNAKRGPAPRNGTVGGIPAASLASRSQPSQTTTTTRSRTTVTVTAKPAAPLALGGALPQERYDYEDLNQPAIIFSRDKVIRREVPQQELKNTAAYDHLVENDFLPAKENPLSTFSIDVDTASYANVRRFLDAGSLPPPDAVRLEELINYFPYDYAPPAADSDKPFAVHLEAAACPWAPEHRLVRIGLKAKEIALDKRPASNLVFLLDVSGSMQPPERLPLIKRAMQMLTEHLTDNDHVAIVTYAGNSGLVLPSTSGDHKDTILAALDHLEAGGSTNGASGITLAYEVAKKAFIKGGTNRVILATDGDFNVGVTSQGDLVRLIQDEAKSGVFLSALGVGTDNYKDSTMQKLADKGNGNYNYLDRLEEARKVLVEQMSGTLLTVAKDVKIQVEFNPALVGSYRLIGYEKRALKKEDFNNDKIDAGEIGAGHSITALYEVVPVGQPVPGETPAVDALKYAAQAAKPAPEPGAAVATRDGGSRELLTVKLRHKAPDADKSERTYEVPLTDGGAADDFAKASPDFKFAAAVAAFGLSLRDSPYKGGATLGAAVEMAQEGKGADPKGYRTEFIALARRAQALKDER